jgi:hypothetical protein
MTAGTLYAAEQSSPAQSSGSSRNASDSVESSSRYASIGRGYDDRWEYDPYYIFPLTRHMPDSELPLAGQIILYPIGFMIDLVQWPLGALAGLGGK